MQDGTRAWDLLPFESVGPVRFGMPKGDVAALFSSPPQTIERDDPDCRILDAFDDASIQVAYGDALTVVAVQVAYDIPIEYRTVRVTGRPFAEVLLELQQMGIELADIDMHLFDALGGALWVTKRGSIDAFVESGYFCCREYFRKYREESMLIGERIRERRRRRELRRRESDDR